MLRSSPGAVSPIGDFFTLLADLAGNPYLFIGSTTGVTSALVMLTLLAVVTERVAFRIWPQYLEHPRVVLKVLRWIAPKLALVMIYFGVGSIALAGWIFLRFRLELPYEAGTQFWSGVGHLVVAAAGIAITAPFWRGLTEREWCLALPWAIGYWSFQVLFLTPQWFHFQGQYDLVMNVAKALIAVSIASNAMWWKIISEKERGESLDL